MDIRHMSPRDVDAVLAAAALFDHEPRRDWTEQFLAREGHHQLIAYVDGQPAGFVTGIENAHPDKGVEMMLYELGVDEAFRRRGIGRALTLALLEIAREQGCSGMWVPIEADNDIAIAAYRSSGAADPESAATMSWAIEECGCEPGESQQ